MMMMMMIMVLFAWNAQWFKSWNSSHVSLPSLHHAFLLHWLGACSNQLTHYCCCCCLWWRVFSMHAQPPCLYTRELSPYSVFLRPSLELSLSLSCVQFLSSHKMAIRAYDGAELIWADIVLFLCDSRRDLFLLSCENGPSTTTCTACFLSFFFLHFATEFTPKRKPYDCGWELTWYYRTVRPPDQKYWATI